MMPKPLIILEQHLGTGARSFISNNAGLLKGLGYSKFLFEMNSEISHQQLKHELQMILKLHGPDTTIHRSTKALNEMLVSLERNGIPYEFIDPETRVQAQQNTERLKSACFSGSQAEMESATDAINTNTRNRDQILQSVILQQTAKHDGGLIYLGGFMHVHLVHTLEKSQPDYRFAMFADSREEYGERFVVDTDQSTWKKCYQADFRAGYYKANVVFFNMAYDSHLSFETIEAACQLTEKRILEENEYPQVVREFERLMPGHVYTVDEHNIVKASKQVAHPTAAVESFVRAGIGLRFFMARNPNGTTQVEVPGLNLKENSHVLLMKKPMGSIS